MPALHLMTFNVQCLPLGVNLFNGLTHDAEGRANRICDDILELKSKDRPDVIALNEVFSEDARDVFEARLGGLYPHQVEQVDLDTLGKFDDSGLMLFSRFPLKNLSTGGTVHTAFYDEGKGADALAPKGIGLVRIDVPISPTTIGFTHMQASYDAEDQHRDVRESQFEQITKAFGDLMTDDGHWGGQLQSSHCTPPRAIEALSAPVGYGGTDDAPSSLRTFTLNFTHEGSYQWIYVETPGTYSWWSGDDNGKRLQVRAYERDNLSRALATHEIDANDLAEELQFINQDHKADLLGRTVAARMPFFLAVRMPNGMPGKGLLGLLTHHGESKTTALRLVPHEPIHPAFPDGKRLGPDDACWFRATMPPTYSGAERTERFEVDNPSDHMVTLELETDGPASSQKVGNSNATLALLHPTTGMTADDTAETVFIRMTRSNLEAVGFGIIWKSPVCYLKLDHPIELFIDDETGPDWPGDDEVQLQINVDGDPLSLFSGQWNEADTGESWPGLHQQIRQRALARVSGDRLGFVQALLISYWEEDITAKGSQVDILAALTDAEPQTVIRRITLEVDDAVSDGRYTFSCSLTKLP